MSLSKLQASQDLGLKLWAGISQYKAALCSCWQWHGAHVNLALSDPGVCHSPHSTSGAVTGLTNTLLKEENETPRCVKKTRRFLVINTKFQAIQVCYH